MRQQSTAAVDAARMRSTSPGGGFVAGDGLGVADGAIGDVEPAEDDETPADMDTDPEHSTLREP